MLATLILIVNVTVLMLLSTTTDNDVLKFTAWALAVLFTVSVIQTVVTKLFGRR
jgi:hypothetical protein